MQPDKIVKQYPLIRLSKRTVEPIKGRFVINADHFHDKASCLAEVYRALGFSKYISYANYDGLADLLTSQAWTEPIVSIDVINVQQLKNVDSDVISNIFNIFQDAIAEWSKNSKQLNVCLVEDA